MRIPSFFNYMTQKYQGITIDVKEQPPQVVDGVSVPIDTPLPNPNGVEFDNLYLDMNGIIHPCFHPPQGLPSPTTYDEVFEEGTLEDVARWKPERWEFLVKFD